MGAQGRFEANQDQEEGSEGFHLVAGISDGKQTLVGQILLPAGLGSRGVELMVKITEGGGEPSVTWVHFDTEGHFSHAFRGELTHIQIAPGIGQEVFLQDDPGGTKYLLLPGAADWTRPWKRITKRPSTTLRPF